MTELRVICTVAEQWRKANFLPSGFIPLLRNQSRNVEIILLIWVITEGRSPEYRHSRTLKMLCACVCVQRYFRPPPPAPPPLSWRGVQTSVQSARTLRPEQLQHVSLTFSAHGALYLEYTTRLLWQVWLQVPVRTHVLRCHSVPVCILIAIRREFRIPLRCEWNPPFFWVVTQRRTVVWCWRFGTSFCSQLHRSNISQIIYQ